VLHTLLLERYFDNFTHYYPDIADNRCVKTKAIPTGWYTCLEYFSLPP